MAGTKGRITRASRGGRRSVYLSDRFGLWQERNSPHITFLNKRQKLHTSITPSDGLLYDVVLMLYQHGLRAED